MYADDTTLVPHLENFGPMNDINTLKQELNKEISKVNTWLLSNKLFLNLAKSKFVMASHLIKTLHGTIIYIPKISMKVARVIGIMNKLKHYLLINFYEHYIILSSTLISFMDFGILGILGIWVIWGIWGIWGILGIFPKTVNNTTKESCKNISPKTIHITYYLYLQRLENYEAKRPIFYIYLQLYKLYHKNTNNLLSSYFNNFAFYYDNVEHNHDLRYAALRFPMTKRE